MSVYYKAPHKVEAWKISFREKIPDWLMPYIEKGLVRKTDMGFEIPVGEESDEEDNLILFSEGDYAILDEKKEVSFDWKESFDNQYSTEEEMKKFSRKLLDKELKNAYNNGIDRGLEQAISIMDFVERKVREDNE
jgi:hypothetical protein